MTTRLYRLDARPMPMAIRWHYVVCKRKPTDDTICAAIALYPDRRTCHILSGIAWLQQQWRQRNTFYIEGRQLGVNAVRIQLHPTHYNAGRLVWVYQPRRSYAC